MHNERFYYNWAMELEGASVEALQWCLPKLVKLQLGKGNLPKSRSIDEERSAKYRLAAQTLCSDGRLGRKCVWARPSNGERAIGS